MEAAGRGESLGWERERPRSRARPAPPPLPVPCQPGLFDSPSRGLLSPQVTCAFGPAALRPSLITTPACPSVSTRVKWLILVSGESTCCCSAPFAVPFSVVATAVPRAPRPTSLSSLKASSQRGRACWLDEATAARPPGPAAPSLQSLSFHDTGETEPLSSPSGVSLFTATVRLTD